MPVSLRLALGAIILGALMGWLVVGAAWVAGRRTHRSWTWLGGFVWGAFATAMILSDCMRKSPGPGPLSDAALPLVVFGVIGWPLFLAYLSWPAERWWLRWIAAQVVMLLNLAPVFLAGIVAVLCSFALA